ncbi:hypothetical protein SEPCBS119000_004549 [Sporothrix epigloea]|uniref:Riboflavin kinase n=1 Tax=Sporothrix epigloea TaxID=1892477 RepID=A0ABP0DSW6_9PEZI
MNDSTTKMNENQQPQTRMAIQRKPVQRQALPNDPPARDGVNRKQPPTPLGVPTEYMPPPPAYGSHLFELGTGDDLETEQRLAEMQLSDAAGASNGRAAGEGLPRQDLNSRATLTSIPTEIPTSTQSTVRAAAPGIRDKAAGASAETRPGAAISEKKEPSIWKTALDETRFFAGGLLTKPYEAAKHFAVLRHSGGLILYRGPSTNVVVTVFSTPSHPVAPADRTVWLQRRGYSGATGLKLKTLVGASGSWLDVTPEREAVASALPAADERGYQRDITKFMKKTIGSHAEKVLANLQPRETLVVRIPAACADGYFRLVVCSGGRVDGSTKRKVLCGSPVFRVASTSTDASIFRGASLSTLPLEAGIKIASLVGNNAVTNAAAPIVSTVQDQISKYQPGAVGTLAAQTAYDNSKLASKVDEAGEAWGRRREQSYHAYGADGSGHDHDEGDANLPPRVLGNDSGPTAPFPLQFQGRVVPGTGKSTAEWGVPTANLEGVSDDVRLRMRGVYFGWAAFVPSKNSPQDHCLPRDWIETIVTIGQSPWGPAGRTATSVVSRSDVVAHLLYDLGTASIFGIKLDILLMGFVRPLAAVVDGAPAVMAAAEHDASLVVSSLSRPAWGPQATLARMASDKCGHSLSDKYVDTRGKLQKQIDRIPMHWAGVRTEAGARRDQLYGNGGFWIKR